MFRKDLENKRIILHLHSITVQPRQVLISASYLKEDKVARKGPEDKQND